MVCGVGVVVVGLVPEDVNSGLHRIGAALHFRGGLGMMAVGLSLRRWFGWISAVAGVAVVAATVALGEGGGAWAEEVGTGALERVAAYGIAGWMVAIGTYLLFADWLPSRQECHCSPAESECGIGRWCCSQGPTPCNGRVVPPQTPMSSRRICSKWTAGMVQAPGELLHLESVP